MTGPTTRTLDLRFVDGLIAPLQQPGGTGALLTSPHRLDLEAISARLCYTLRRRQLFEGLVRYVTATRALPVPPSLQVIGGSFLDEVDQPGDIDIANIVTTVDADAMALYFDKAFTMAIFGVDPLTFILRGDPHDDALGLFRISAYYSYRRDGRQRSLIAIADSAP